MLRRSRRHLRQVSGYFNAAVQPLEQRVLPAGNVTVTVRGSDVVLVGDTRANHLEISGLGGELVITGLEGTTINREDEFVLDFPVRSLSVSLNSGDDILQLQDIELTGGLSVKLGAGANIARLENVSVDGAASMTGSSKRDVIVALDSVFGNALTIGSGSGNDVLGLGNVEVGGLLKINSGAGSDYVAAHMLTAKSVTMISSGGGADVTTIFESTFESIFKYTGGSGAEKFLVQSTAFEGIASVTTGTQNDLVSLRGENDFQRSATFSGGKGQDTFDDDESSRFASPRAVLQFENRAGLDDEAYDTLLEGIVAFLDQWDLGGLIGGGSPELALHTDIAQLLAGTPEIILFQAVVDSEEPATTVKLHLATEVGEAGTFLLELFDDGSALHGDATAGDGVFSNTLAVQLLAPGLQSYVAVAEFADSGETVLALATLNAIAAPDDETLQARIDLADEMQALLDELLGEGQTLTQALAALAAALQANPDVLPGSIETTGASIFWMSIEGIVFAAFGNQLLDAQRHSASAGSQATTPLSPSAPATSPNAAEDDEEFCGEAIVLAPFAWQFEPWDESNEIATMLDAAGIDVRQVRNTTAGAQSVTLNDFRDLRTYETIVITSHGDSSLLYGTLLNTGDAYTLEELRANLADVVTGRVALTNGSFSITPRFISRYAGSLNDSIVYVGSCRSAFNSSLADAFLGQGAAAFVGYTDYVGSDFANTRGQSLYSTLLDSEEIGQAPGINVDRETDSDPAKYVLFGDSTAKLPNECYLLNDWDLYVEYKWPLSQRDLDTSTHFLGAKAGFACGVGPHLNWSGDDTTAGGTETVIVDLDAAFDAGQWDDQVNSALHAGWYIPAEGSGPATLTVGLRNQLTGEIKEVTTRAISPGAQNGCATTSVGTVVATVSGEGDEATISYVLA